MTTIYNAFVKLFEAEDHANDFLSGKLYMNSIQGFKKWTDTAGELRGDPFEGIIALYQPTKIEGIKLGNHMIPASALATLIVMHGNELLKENVFCMYSLNSSGHDSVSSETLKQFRRALELHESCFGLGKHCVVILDARKFLERCLAAATNLNLDPPKMNLVRYFDESEFHGLLDPNFHSFQKRIQYQHQREYRIKINFKNISPEARILEVGDLSDIARLTNPEEFNSELEISLPDGSRG